jgi:hypothetical protein
LSEGRSVSIVGGLCGKVAVSLQTIYDFHAIGRWLDDLANEASEPTAADQQLVDQQAHEGHG